MSGEYPAKNNHTAIFKASIYVTKTRNTAKMYHQLLMIFIRWHSQDSMLQNTCMFCSIKFIFISKNSILHWRVMFRKCIPTKTSGECAHQFTKILIINVDKIYNNCLKNYRYTTPATAVSDFRKPLRRKHIFQYSEYIAQPSKLWISVINILLPLLIFVRMHSQDCYFHKKCCFCSK